MVVAFMLCLGECDASGEVVRFTSSSVRSPVCLAIDSSRRRRSRSRTLVWNRRQLEQLLREYVEHYNTHRPHRSLQLLPPQPPPNSSNRPVQGLARVCRRDVLGGLIHEYDLVA